MPLSGSWIASRAASTWTNTHMGCVAGGDLTHHPDLLLKFVAIISLNLCFESEIWLGDEICASGLEFCLCAVVLSAFVYAIQILPPFSLLIPDTQGSCGLFLLATIYDQRFPLSQQVSWHIQEGAESSMCVLESLMWDIIGIVTPLGGIAVM